MSTLTAIITSEAFLNGFFTLLGIVVTAILAPIIVDKVKAKKSGAEEKPLPKLEDHHIFSRIEMLRNYISVKFTLQNKGKELVFKDLLLNYLSIWEKGLKELAQEIETMDVESDEVMKVKIQTVIMKNFNKNSAEFSNYYKSTSYTSDEQRCLMVVMDKFNSWNYARTDSLCNSLMNICTCEFYPTKEIKSAVIFDTYINLFTDMISDAEQTISQLNGDLRGLVFRGVTL